MGKCLLPLKRAASYYFVLLLSTFLFSSFLSLSLSRSVALSFLFVAHPLTFSPPPFHVFCDSSLFLIHWGRGPFAGSSQGFLFFIFDASTGVLQLSVTAESRSYRGLYVIKIGGFAAYEANKIMGHADQKKESIF